MSKITKALFPYEWKLSNGYPAKGVSKSELKCFGTFVCAGGSTMGYKLAGFNHLGGVEIDPKVAKVYKDNHNPKHLFVESVTDFNKRKDIPKELYDLDLLDGSPPCSNFSMAGQREEVWGKRKKFSEGQAEQVLEDLVFTYCETINLLRPKVALLENVQGMIIGKAMTYTKRVIKLLDSFGYRTQVFLLNGAAMGLPQARKRVFFIAVRKDFSNKKLSLDFNVKPVPFKDIADPKGESNGTPIDKSTQIYAAWRKVAYGENFGNANLGGKDFGRHKTDPNKPLPTVISSSGGAYHHNEPRALSNTEILKASSFPLDFKYGIKSPKWYCGMSVPPLMTASIAYQIRKQLFDDC